MEHTFKARGGIQIFVHEVLERVIVHRRTMFGMISKDIHCFSVHEIEAMSVRRSVYDIPFLESTAVFFLKSGRKIKVKRMRAGDAKRMVERIEAIKHG